MHIGVILSLEGSWICFLESLDKQFCNFLSPVDIRIGNAIVKA